MPAQARRYRQEFVDRLDLNRAEFVDLDHQVSLSLSLSLSDVLRELSQLEQVIFFEARNL